MTYEPLFVELLLDTVDNQHWLLCGCCCHYKCWKWALWQACSNWT